MADRRPAQVVDLAAGFATTLHRAGLAVTPARAAQFARSLGLVPPADRATLYWTARICLVTDRAQLPVFDAVFSAVFDGRLDPADSRGDPNAPPPVGSEPRVEPAVPDQRPAGPAPSASTGPQVAQPGPGGADGEESQQDAVLAVASRDEHLNDTAFADLESDELAEVRRLVARIGLVTPVRRTRRTRPSRRPEHLDVRRTVRLAQRTGGEPVRLGYERRAVKPRQLILICDVSASMQPYSRVFLSLLQGAVTGVRAEAFVFSTRLTRLTRQLSLRDPDQALAQAAAAAPDWAGGTRLAESLRRFTDDFGRRGLARGAVVLILSDGWAQDEPAEVSVQMARLSRLAHRIVWVNPRKAAAGYEPLVGGMAAALPFCDAFVSGHSLAALEEVVTVVGAAR